VTVVRALSGPALLWAAEAGAAQHPLDRALTLLAAALPDVPRDRLAALSVGERDALLLALRERQLGAALAAYAECPRCGERLEFTLDAAALRGGTPPAVAAEAPEHVYALAVDGYALRFRLPDSRDLAAVVLGSGGDPAAGQALLVRRCVLRAARDGADVGPDDLPAAVLVALAERMAEADPRAETLLDLRCPACDHAWQVLFDPGAFLWTELAVQARRLLREVHTLARAYGWREADTLALSPWRRRCYLELVEG
jgi:hypothetical protein